MVSDLHDPPTALNAKHAAHADHVERRSRRQAEHRKGEAPWPTAGPTAAHVHVPRVEDLIGLSSAPDGANAPPLDRRHATEILIHLSQFNRSLRTLIAQIGGSLADPEDSSYYRALRVAYEAMMVLERRTEWLANAPLPTKRR